MARLENNFLLAAKKRNLVFFALLVLLIAYRTFVLFKFGAVYTDQDQAILWQGVSDFHNGNFYEPRFYGQSYNTMLEAMLALVPYWCGIPVHIALPLVTTLLALIPFVVPAWLIHFRKRQNGGLLILLLALLFPLDYDLITTLPRGFITGIAMTSLALFFYDSPKKWSFPLFFFFLSLGFICNPNCIILAVPMAALYFFDNRKNSWLYIGGIIGLLAGSFLWFQMNLFYVHHPEYELHRPMNEFSTANFGKGISSLDLFFGDVSPIVWKQGWFALILLLVSSLFFWFKRRKIQALVLLGTLLLILSTLFSSRLYNAEDTVFYSYSRMFLAIPALFAFTIYIADIRIRQSRWLVIAALSVIGIKGVLMQEKLEHVLDHPYVYAAKVDYTLDYCSKLREVARKNNADLIIITDFHHLIYNYACDCNPEKFPATLFPTYERRTWRLKEERNRTHRNVLIIDEEHHYADTAWLQPVIGEPRWFVLKQNTLKTPELMQKLGIYPREY